MSRVPPGAKKSLCAGHRARRHPAGLAGVVSGSADTAGRTDRRDARWQAQEFKELLTTVGLRESWLPRGPSPWRSQSPFIVVRPCSYSLRSIGLVERSQRLQIGREIQTRVQRTAARSTRFVSAHPAHRIHGPGPPLLPQSRPWSRQGPVDHWRMLSRIERRSDGSTPSPH
jgi:hypothetical protein